VHMIPRLNVLSRWHLAAWRKPRRTCMPSAQPPTLGSSALSTRRHQRSSRVNPQFSNSLHQLTNCSKHFWMSPGWNCHSASCRFARCSVGASWFLHWCEKQGLWGSVQCYRYLHSVTFRCFWLLSSQAVQPFSLSSLQVTSTSTVR